MLLGRFLLPVFNVPSAKNDPSKRVASQAIGGFLYIGTGGTKADNEPTKTMVISNVIRFQIWQGILILPQNNIIVKMKIPLSFLQKQESRQVLTK